MSHQNKKHRSHLPIPTPERTGLITYDARDPDTRFPPIEQLRPPKGAPNVLLVLIDDAGFGSSSAFGGPCRTPNFESLATDGVKFTRFHTTALCSPTRQALLTGRNHHSAGMGGITEIATGAPGATHAPHHVPKEWADKYKGKFDAGWDKLRDETFARQLKLGVIPPDCKLTARHKEIPAWDEMPESLKPVLRRQMEVYAGFLEYTDHHIGRLIDSLKKLNILDDTLVYVIIGDNGASAEGTLNGTFNEMLNFNGLAAA